MPNFPKDDDLQSAQESLAEGEAWFRVMADSPPVLIWMSNLDKARIWFNQVWLDFRGRTLEQERGDRWAEGVHPDDFDGCLNTYVTAFDRHEPFEMEYRLLRADGEYRWVLDRGRVRYGSDGSFNGYVGSCTDITNMKSIEEQLERDREVLRELVEMGDCERKLVAHEIHDGLLQHVFAADMFVQTATAMLSQVAAKSVVSKLENAQSLLGKAIEDGRRLINSLRPLILDEEGVIPAVQHRVAELNGQDSIKIELIVRATLGRVPGVWEGNLFRIIDEALTNMIRHSQSPVGEVRFTHSDGWVHVEIEDQGVGFEFSTVASGCFGLRSILERTRLFNGKCNIDSSPGKGTLISISLPLPSSG